MSKQKFSPTALDQLLSDAMEDTNQLQNELKTNEYQEQDDVLPVPPVSPQINQLVNKTSQGATVDYSRVYSQLERLIENRKYCTSSSWRNRSRCESELKLQPQLLL